MKQASEARYAYLRKMVVCSIFGWPDGDELSTAIGLLDSLISEHKDMVKVIERLISRSGQLDPFTEREASIVLARISGEA